MHLLLTNDDGIESPGLAAVYEHLTPTWEVTVVAPASDQSGVGRSRSDLSYERADEITIDDHEWGYVVDGTPADCVAVGLRHIPEAEQIDLVVSGANNGPNVGSYILGHSGTVGAAVEAAFLGTPAVAVSGYDHETYFPEDGDNSFDAIAAATRDLLALIEDTAAFDGDVDYLNVNAPATGGDTLAVTKPLADYDTRVVDNDGETNVFESNYWATHPVEGDGFPIGLDNYTDDYPPWSDRAAIVDGEISVTPLGTPQSVVDPPADFVAALDRYPLEES
ncbi:5'/3'-nucleotidase SurE [Halonotius sp. F2-221B]|uniref:5'/3'-nucleotidase SurE n=1 Tax=Halonotius sp. F2-221B TaxID=2731620 RepID=UPI00398B4E48